MLLPLVGTTSTGGVRGAGLLKSSRIIPDSRSTNHGIVHVLIFNGVAGGQGFDLLMILYADDKAI